MRLLFIRHGDPDYERDTVTEKGEREIELLADRLEKENIGEIYVSPLGRAQKTAQATLRRLRRTGKTLAWLQEFVVPVHLPETGEEHLIWDFMPSFMEKHPALYSACDWLKEPFIAGSDVPRRYAEVCEGLDALLAEHGYRREGGFYRAEKPNRKTLVFFCHLGATCMMLSHLFRMSPVALLQHFAGAPTSVTTVYTEERERGIASFRALSLGDTSHLYAAQEPLSFSARFCETFEGGERR